MLLDILEAKALEGHRLWLRFEDGTKGTVDLSDLRFEGIFKPLQDPAFFARVTIDPELGTISWPNGADLDPDVLYSRLTGKEIQQAGSPT